MWPLLNKDQAPKIDPLGLVFNGGQQLVSTKVHLTIEICEFKQILHLLN